MLSSNEIASKGQTANQVMWQLNQVLDQISGKTILDVGFGFGFNAAAMSAQGAKVFGVEPQSDAYTWAVQTKKIDEDHGFCGKLQTMPKRFADQVDVATVLLWNISRSEYDQFLDALSRKISPQGIVIIGIHDQLYISDPYGVAVKPHAKRYFGTVKEEFFPGTWNQYLLICTNPNR